MIQIFRIKIYKIQTLTESLVLALFYGFAHISANSQSSKGGGEEEIYIIIILTSDIYNE